MLIIPGTKSKSLDHGPSAHRLRPDIWRAFVTYAKPDEFRYYNPQSDKLEFAKEFRTNSEIKPIKPFTEQDQLSWRREFVDSLTDSAIAKVQLTEALSHPSPLHQFSMQLRSVPQLVSQWHKFLFSKVFQGVKEWAEDNKIDVDRLLLGRQTQLLPNDQRKEIYATLDRIPVEALLDIMIPLRHLLPKNKAHSGK